MPETVQIRGLSEINDRIKALGPAGKRAARRALTHAAKLIQVAAENEAPISKTEGNTRRFGLQKMKSGHLKRNIISRITETQQGIKASVGARAKIFWAKWVEKGTKPHFLSKGSKAKRPRASRDTGKQHPGAKAHPFLGPAFEGNKAAALSLIRLELSKTLFK